MHEKEFELLVEIAQRGTNEKIYDEIRKIAEKAGLRYAASYPNVFVLLDDIKQLLQALPPITGRQW